MEKNYVLTAKGGEFAPFPTTRAQRRSLRRAILDTMSSIPGAFHDALRCYSDKPVTWDIPTLSVGTLKGVNIHPVPYGSVSDLVEAVNSVPDLLEAIRKRGWTKFTKDKLENLFGDLATVPYIFDTQEANLAHTAVTAAALLGFRLPNSTFHSGDTFALGYVYKDSEKNIGVVDGNIVGTKGATASEQQIGDVLWGARGTVTTHTYGVYDRLLLWTEQSFTLLPEAERVRFALAALKLSMFPDEEAEFETEVRSAGTAVATVVPSGMTEELVDYIRDLWLSANESSAEEALLKIFSKLVPEFYDSDQFKRFTGVLPELGQELSKRQLTTVSRGVEKLATDIYNKVINERYARDYGR